MCIFPGTSYGTMHNSTYSPICTLQVNATTQSDVGNKLLLTYHTKHTWIAKTGARTS